MWQLVIAMVIAAEVGWLASWFVFNKQFYQPQRKLLKQVLADWGKSIEHQAVLMAKAYGLEVPKVEEDGSMKSPIQIKEE